MSDVKTIHIVSVTLQGSIIYIEYVSGKSKVIPISTALLDKFKELGSLPLTDPVQNDR